MKIVQEVEHTTYCKSYLKVQSFGFTKCKTVELLTVSGSYKQSHRNKTSTRQNLFGFLQTLVSNHAFFLLHQIYAFQAEC